MLEKIVIGLLVLLASIYLLRRTLKKGSGCGCSGGDCASGGCGCSSPDSHKPLDISSCACQRKDA